MAPLEEVDLLRGALVPYGVRLCLGCEVVGDIATLLGVNRALLEKMPEVFGYFVPVNAEAGSDVVRRAWTPLEHGDDVLTGGRIALMCGCDAEIGDDFGLVAEDLGKGRHLLRRSRLCCGLGRRAHGRVELDAVGAKPLDDGLYMLDIGYGGIGQNEDRLSPTSGIRASFSLSLSIR